MDCKYKLDETPLLHHLHPGSNEAGIFPKLLQYLFLGSSFWMGPLPMEKKETNEAFSSLKFGHDDIKKHLRRISNIVVVGVKDNRGMDSDVRFMSNQIGFHDFYMNYYYRDLREVLATVDITKEEVMKLARMSHCNHCQDSPGDEARPMEYISVTHPVGQSSKKM